MSFLKRHKRRRFGMSSWVHGKHAVCHYVFIPQFLAAVDIQFFYFSFNKSIFQFLSLGGKLHLPSKHCKKRVKTQLQTRIKIIRPLFVFQQERFQPNRALFLCHAHNKPSNALLVCSYRYKQLNTVLRNKNNSLEEEIKYNFYSYKSCTITLLYSSSELQLILGV